MEVRRRTNTVWTTYTRPWLLIVRWGISHLTQSSAAALKRTKETNNTASSKNSRRWDFLCCCLGRKRSCAHAA